MKNSESRIDKILVSLDPIISKYELDKVTLAGLICGSLETTEQSLPSANCLYRTHDKKIKTLKPQNFKENFNLGYAFNTAFKLKKVFDLKDIGLVLTLLSVINDLFTSCTIELDEISSLVLLSLYRLQHGDADRIFTYAKTISLTDCCIEITKDSCNTALKTLDNLHCITMVDGEYIFQENVFDIMF